VLTIRKGCSDPNSEMGCATSYGPGSRVVVSRMLEPGTYYLIVDGRGAKAEGDYNVHLDVTPYNEPPNEDGMLHGNH